jgi:hypothetical protein
VLQPVKIPGIFILFIFWRHNVQCLTLTVCRLKRNKRNSHTDVPPFWPDKAMRDVHCWEWQQSSILAFLSLPLTHGHKKNMLLHTQVCFRVPPVYTVCTALSWPAEYAEVTLHLWHSAVYNYHDFVRPQRKANHYIHYLKVLPASFFKNVYYLNMKKRWLINMSVYNFERN